MNSPPNLSRSLSTSQIRPIRNMKLENNRLRNINKDFEQKKS